MVLETIFKIYCFILGIYPHYDYIEVLINQKKITMKKKDKKTLLIDALGKGAREEYLTENPHGFKSVKKVHKSKKTYSRKSKHKKN